MLFVKHVGLLMGRRMSEIKIKTSIKKIGVWGIDSLINSLNTSLCEEVDSRGGSVGISYAKRGNSIEYSAISVLDPVPVTKEDHEINSEDKKVYKKYCKSCGVYFNTEVKRKTLCSKCHVINEVAK